MALTPQCPPPGVWTVIFLDGNGGIAALHTISREYLAKRVDEWATQELARIRAPFPELIAGGGKSVAESFVVYGSDIEMIEGVKP